MSEHTPEPWGVPVANLSLVSTRDWKAIADTYQKWVIDDATSAEACANASRIVACVNFCKGYENDILEHGPQLDELIAYYPDMDAEGNALPSKANREEIDAYKGSLKAATARVEELEVSCRKALVHCHKSTTSPAGRHVVELAIMELYAALSPSAPIETTP